MSNLTRLQAVSSSLDTAINKAENLPDASGGGGASIETCTVYCQMAQYSVYATVYRNGKITYAYYTRAPAPTVADVICGSIIMIQCDMQPNTVAGATLLDSLRGFQEGEELPVYVYEITVSAGETVTFSI